MRTEISNLQTRSRLDQLIISGIPESSYAEAASTELSSTELDLQDITADDGKEKNENLTCKQTFLHFTMNKLQIPMKPSDIESAFRLKKGKSDLHRPMIISFSSNILRNQVYQARTKLRGLKMYINEHLSDVNAELFAETHKLVKSKKIYKTWTNNGSVFALRTSDSKPDRIVNKMDLCKLMK